MSVDLLSPQVANAPPAMRSSEILSAVDLWLAQHTRWILALTTVSYVLLSLDLFRRIIAKTNGQFVFPLDDTYITMALAKNFALHGSWSISNGTFQSATSTPAFLLLLSGLYRLTGPTV